MRTELSRRDHLRRSANRKGKLDKSLDPLLKRGVTLAIFKDCGKIPDSKHSLIMLDKIGDKIGNPALSILIGM